MTMLRMLGSPRRTAAGLTRRETLAAGALTFFGGGLNAANLIAAEQARLQHAQAGKKPKAKNVILLYLLGGAATQDMYDLKLNAPSGIRSEFKPIDTNVPGIQVCEHLPKTSKWMHRTALIRSLNHNAGCHNCLPSYSGHEVTMPDQHPRGTDPPSMGSVCEFLENRSDPNELPAYVYLPHWLGWGQSFRRAGPYGGFLGKRYDACTSECEPRIDAGVSALPGKPATVRGTPILPNSRLPEEITLDRFNTRRSLLAQIDDEQRRLEAAAGAAGKELGDSARYGRAKRQAFGVLGASKLADAFDLSKEPAKTQESYGNTLFGHTALVGRRLIERGARFVNVTFDLYHTTPGLYDYDAWDTHRNNFGILKDNKLPIFDQVYSALLGDLEEKGLLDETLVVVTSEMGRTPKVNGSGGRDHWTHCYGSMLAGAGIKGGTVVGESDATAAMVKDRPVSTTELCATIYELLGIDAETHVPDRTGRPHFVRMGAKPVHELLS
jgi:hypothetical protein